MTTMKRIAKVKIIATCLMGFGLLISACNGGNNIPTPERPTPKRPLPEQPVPEQPTPETPTPEVPTPEQPKEENKLMPKFFIKSIMTEYEYYGKVKSTTAFTYDSEKRVTRIVDSSDYPGDIPTEKSFSYKGDKATIKLYAQPGVLDKHHFFDGVIAKNFLFVSEVQKENDTKTERTIDPKSVKTNSDGRITSFEISDTYTKQHKPNDVEVIKHHELVTITWTDDNITALKVERGELGKSKSLIMELEVKYNHQPNLTNLSIIQYVARNLQGVQLALMNLLPYNVLQPKDLPSEIIRREYKSTSKPIDTFRFEYQMDDTHKRPIRFTRIQNDKKKDEYFLTY